MPTEHVSVRYWGTTEEERKAEFEADLPEWAAEGWRVVKQSGAPLSGSAGLSLEVTYVRGDPDPRELAQAQMPPQGRPAAGASRPPAPAFAQGFAQGFAPGFGQGYSQGYQYGIYPLAPARPTVPETRSNRYLRRILVIGGFLGFIYAMASTGPSIPPLPSQYYGLAWARFFESAFALGLVWYVLRFRRIPMVLRSMGATLLSLFCLWMLWQGAEYLSASLGQP